MSELKKIQRNFAKHIFDKNDKQILQNISYNKEEALARLNIYRNNVFGGFESILSSIFSVCKKILGDKKFFQYVNKYYQEFDSQSGNLDEYGESFFKVFKNHKLKYLSDLAKFELIFYHSYFSADAYKDFDLEAFKNINEEKILRIIFQLNPSIALFSSPYPIFSIWQGKKNVAKKREFILIRRYNSEIIAVKLTHEEFIFLEGISHQQPLYEIYQKLCQKLNKEVDIGTLISRFIENRTISSFLIE